MCTNINMVSHKFLIYAMDLQTSQTSGNKHFHKVMNPFAKKQKKNVCKVQMIQNKKKHFFS